MLRDRRLRSYVVAAVVLMIGGYGSQEAGYSLFVVNNLHLSVHVIGVIFFFNTTTIVCSQLWVLNRIEGKSRTKVMASVALLWFVFWVILDAALALPKALAIVSLCVAMVVFAVGETMLSPVGAALVNEIAPEHLRVATTPRPASPGGPRARSRPPSRRSISTITWATGGPWVPA